MGCGFAAFELWCRLNRRGGVWPWSLLSAITTCPNGFVQLESFLHVALVYMHACMGTGKCACT